MSQKSFIRPVTDGFKRIGTAQKIPANDNVIEALISGNPNFEAAVADLVDNSIDAGARNIEIRFHRRETQSNPNLSPISVSVWDDGSGMKSLELIEAVKLSAGERRRNGDLGKFGVGMKAASFAKSSETSIFSRGSDGNISGIELAGPVGDRSYESLYEETFGSGFTRSHTLVPENTGTIVRWESLRGIPRFDSDVEIRRFVQNQSEQLSIHLGVVFHRFLVGDRPNAIKISILQVDAFGGVGIPTLVSPIDPIQPNENVHDTFRFSTEFQGNTVSICVQVSPKGSQFHSLSKVSSGTNGSGVYIYRNSRIIQLGGWEGLIALGGRDYRLLRICLDIPAALEESGYFSVAHQKNGCVFSDELRDEILSAQNPESGSDIRRYAHDAELKQKLANPKEVRATSLVRVESGLPLRVINQLNSTTLSVGTPIAVHYVAFPKGNNDLFRIESANRKLLINSRYQDGITSEPEKFATMMFLICRNWLWRETISGQDNVDIDSVNSLLRVAFTEEKGGGNA